MAAKFIKEIDEESLQQGTDKIVDSLGFSDHEYENKETGWWTLPRKGDSIDQTESEFPDTVYETEDGEVEQGATGDNYDKNTGGVVRSVKSGKHKLAGTGVIEKLKTKGKRKPATEKAKYGKNR